ncbi:MAG TPA: SH3 domain-containing protein [Amycolatopsis sp.]|nr:SH3 domain-containing protein [Amycolatopsis sp.]
MILGLPKKIVVIAAVLIGVGIIYLMGIDKQQSEATGGSTGCKVTVTADVLNVRAAPDPGSGIVGKYNQNAVTGAEVQIENGFRKLADNKWAKTDFLQPVAGTNCG